MKKVLILAGLMVLVLGVAANAYVFQAIATNASGTDSMGTITFGTYASASSKDITPNSGTAAEVAVASNQSWKPAVGADSGSWKVQYFVTTDPKAWTLALWSGNDYGYDKATLKIWLNNASGFTPGNWTLQDAVTGKVYWSGDVTSVGSKTNSILSIEFDTPKTATPNAEAIGLVWTSVPEPGSMLAMLSGLVGLVGFGIRRRK